MDNREFLWKSVQLSRELSASGSLIYNGLKCFHDLEILENEDEIFEFLYNISVGIERLAKVAVVLIEHENAEDQTRFENSLITHNHSQLIARIKAKYPLKLGRPHNSFLQLLENFYKFIRYERFSIESLNSPGNEKDILKAFITEELEVVLDSSKMFAEQNTDRMRKIIGKIIGKITSELYAAIVLEASEQNIYTYELRYNSKAFKIFTRKEFDFYKETILWKELLVFLLHNTESSGVMGIIKELQPLSFEAVTTQDYISCFQNDVAKLETLDELEDLYQDLDDRKKRLEILDCIGNPSVSFDDDEREFEDELEDF